MLKEKVKSDAALHSKNSRMQATQMVSLSLGSSKKNKFSNSKINSVRHNSNTKFKTTKSSPEKIEKAILPKEDQLASTKLKPKQSPNNILNLNNNLTNNYNTILQNTECISTITQTIKSLGHTEVNVTYSINRQIVVV